MGDKVGSNIPGSTYSLRAGPTFADNDFVTIWLNDHLYLRVKVKYRSFGRVVDYLQKVDYVLISAGFNLECN